ncbi:hypothetical protein [Nocardia abscessus]|uniref:hypothetical protein n=1 Tax=Nocardia abscessus TaxID=120957 RepID=UPI002457C1E5|nr:hypothetical protein [Nocardia abscessus]
MEDHDHRSPHRFSPTGKRRLWSDGSLPETEAGEFVVRVVTSVADLPHTAYI